MVPAAAYRPAQNDYYDYQLLAQLQLQQQILANQKQILEQQQQQYALASLGGGGFGAAGPGPGNSGSLEALSLQTGQVGGGGGGGGGLNALAQSAMARKTRALEYGGGIGVGHPTGGPAQGGHHRRSSSASNLSGSSYGSLVNPPSVVVSTPTDTDFPRPPYLQAQRFTVDVDGVGRFNPSANGANQAPRRPSQAGSLSKALSGRRQGQGQSQSQPGQPRSVSITGPPGNSSNKKVQLSLSGLPSPRSVSESVLPPLPSPTLSPFATTFQPLPPSPIPNSPFINNNNNMTTTGNRITYGQSRSPSPSPSLYNNGPVAIAIRAPRGPAAEEELTALNFASRLRRRAIAVLSNRSGGRIVSVGGA